MIERLSPPGIATPRGPYSPAVRAGDFIFVSGQVPVDPATDKMSPGDIQHETRLALNNVKRILEGVGSSLQNEVVAKVSVFLSDGADFARMNEVYTEFFGAVKPARTTVVCKFMADIKVEIDCVAFTGRTGVIQPSQADSRRPECRATPLRVPPQSGVPDSNAQTDRATGPQ